MTPPAVTPLPRKQPDQKPSVRPGHRAAEGFDVSPASRVLGEFATAGTLAAAQTLPFTGFPLWIAVAIGLALVAGGLALRRARPEEVSS